MAAVLPLSLLLTLGTKVVPFAIDIAPDLAQMSKAIKAARSPDSPEGRDATPEEIEECLDRAVETFEAVHEAALRHGIPLDILPALIQKLLSKRLRKLEASGEQTPAPFPGELGQWKRDVWGQQP